MSDRNRSLVTRNHGAAATVAHAQPADRRALLWPHVRGGRQRRVHTHARIESLCMHLPRHRDSIMHGGGSKGAVPSCGGRVKPLRIHGSQRDIIEAPCLVNGGHGASLRH
eukprot:COSAG01_NODE_21981_length_877_cov_1.006427_2_plen_109_part_01